MAIDDFGIVRRSLTGRMFSTATTVLTVGVAVGLLLLLLSMKDSGRRAFERGYGNMHLLVTADASPMVSVLNSVFYANMPPNYIRWETYRRLLEEHPFAWAIPTALGDSYRGRPVMATGREFFTAFEPVRGQPWEVVRGRVFERPFEVVIGADAARSLGLSLGDRIYLMHGASRPDGSPDDGAHEHREFTFEVVGVLGLTGSAHDRALFVDMTSSWILHAHDRRLAELGPRIELTTEADLTDADRRMTGLYTRLLTRPGQEVPANLPQVFSALRADPGVIVASPADQIRALFRIVGNVDRVLLGMAVAVLVSSGIAIMLALYNSMEQRRRQIAVLRVLGCSRPRVFGLVMTESAMLGVMGAVLGVGLAAIGARITADVMRRELGLVIEPVLAPETVLGVVVGAIALACAAGIVPAVTAYRTSVARSLRPLV